ncbi:hypothetical protein [Nonomuraea sp. NPDC049709]|uniref:hypothetical protein n=1 Tax=Nonomuraea sp. NPDC049709 TaxID=3154736 RepID=UPI003447E4FF
MDLRRLRRSPALLCALTAPLLYAAVNLISFRIAAHPTGLNPWYEVPWNDTLLEDLDRAVARARAVTVSLTVILATEAALLAALDRPGRRTTVAGGLAFVGSGLVYLLTLALAVAVNPTTSPWRINDEYDLAALGPDWYMPALIGVAVSAIAGVAVRVFTMVREGLTS